MFRKGQLAVHGLAILLVRNEAGISNRGKTFLHHAVYQMVDVLDGISMDTADENLVQG